MVEETRDYYEMSLAEIREYKGFSRRELSRATGASENTLYLIEKRAQIPRVDTAIAISRILGISLKEFCHSLGLDIGGIPPDGLSPSKPLAVNPPVENGERWPKADRRSSRNQGGEGENQH